MSSLLKCALYPTPLYQLGRVWTTCWPSSNSRQRLTEGGGSHGLVSSSGSRDWSSSCGAPARRSTLIRSVYGYIPWAQGTAQGKKRAAAEVVAAAPRVDATNAVAVRRWVLTQKVLVEQGSLSAAQLRYLTVLGGWLIITTSAMIVSCVRRWQSLLVCAQLPIYHARFSKGLHRVDFPHLTLGHGYPTLLTIGGNRCHRALYDLVRVTSICRVAASRVPVMSQAAHAGLTWGISWQLLKL